jgi:hypothetical protein
MLAFYEGINTSLRTSIQEFEHGYRLLMRATTNITKRRVINNIEARLMLIIQRAVEGNEYDRIWLAANRQEINQLLNQFDQIRTDTHNSRERDLNNNLQHSVRNAYDNIENLISSSGTVVAAAAVNATLYALKAGAVGASVTGVSAFSFFGGPVIGGAVTGAVGGVSALATAGAAVYGGVKGAVSAKEGIEESIRAQFQR